MQEIKQFCKFLYHLIKHIFLFRKEFIAQKYALNKEIYKIPNSFLILEPAMTSKGNLGDEALILGVIKTIKKNYINSKISILHYSTNDGMLNEDVNLIPFNPDKLDQTFFDSVSQFERFYVLGADIMDGHYSNYSVIFPIQLCRILSKLDIKTNIISFSYNSHPTKYSKFLFKYLPNNIRISCRDFVSLDRLKKITNHDIECYPDIALTMPPSLMNNILENIKKDLFSNPNFVNKKKILINLNPLPFQKNNLETKFLTISKNTISTLIKEGFFICLAPHVYRDGDSDLNAQKIVYSKLSKEEKSSVYVLDQKLHANEIKRLITYFDLVITGRMHMAIATIGMGQACGIVGYQGKCEGFINLFDLPKSCLINFEDIILGNNFLDFIHINYNNLIINKERCKLKLDINISEAEKHVKAIK
ncbi:polysaccharide pyruvyl transferase family protein [Faecalicoccus acidiformans]|uniref:polysaccharide pyruvyl transferase family protein n=1 Tax=Faecalicoccus acidiformans TaxID=915173 RepID=UPI0023577558|nr:polysaccharide pyruvyl transferase family protein [Faecalicoccus acidiformans]